LGNGLAVIEAGQPLLKPLGEKPVFIRKMDQEYFNRIERNREFSSDYDDGRSQGPGITKRADLVIPMGYFKDFKTPSFPCI